MNRLTLFFFLLNGIIAFSQVSTFHENLEGHNCPDANYNNGIFKSKSNPFWWKYNNCRNAVSPYQIDGKGLILRLDNGTLESSQIKGGISYLSLMMNRCWSSTEQRRLTVEIIPEDGSAIVSKSFTLDGTITANTLFEITNLNVNGLFKIRITNKTVGTAIVIDDIKWTSKNLIEETYTPQLFSDYLFNPVSSSLYDFSYAGYKSGDHPIPDVPLVASVTDFGAVANDGVDDTAAFQNAINFVSALGGGAVSIPAGVFNFNTQANDSYLLMKDKVVLRGAGQEQGGTVLFLNNFINSDYGQGLISSEVSAFTNTNMLLTADAPKGSHILNIASTNSLKAGDAIQIRMLNPTVDGIRQNDLSRFLTFPLEPQTEWTSYTRFAPFLCFFEIESVISSTSIKIKQPLMYDMLRTWQASVNRLNFLTQIGIENLRIESNFQGGYSHHKNWEVDYGWCGFVLRRIKDSWIRNVTLKNMVWDIKLMESMNVTVENVIIEGLDGHHGIKMNGSNFCLIQNCYVDAFRTHAVGCESGAHANVFTNIGVNKKNGMIDFHGGGLSSHNLVENINNSYVNSGGAEENMPHAGQHNVFWNIISNATTASNKPGLDFFNGYWNYDAIPGLNYECYKLYPKSVVAGVYYPAKQVTIDKNTGDRRSEWIEVEGLNAEGISPSSLYNFQLTTRKAQSHTGLPSNKHKIEIKPTNIVAKSGSNQLTFLLNRQQGEITIFTITGQKIFYFKGVITTNMVINLSVSDKIILVVYKDANGVIQQKVII